MERIQAIVCFENGTWLNDYVKVQEGQDFEEAVESYMQEYEQARDGLGIIRKLLPGIIHISDL